MLKRLYFLLLPLAYHSSCISAELFPVTLGTGDGRPYIYTENNEVYEERPGFSIEILREVAKRKNWALEFKVLPFRRQIKEAESGYIDGLVALFKPDAPHFVYPKEAIGKAQNCFYALVNSKFKFKKVNDLKDFRIGITNGYNYGMIDDYIAKQEHNNIVVVADNDKDALSRLLKLLEYKRIDAFIEAELVVNNRLNEIAKDDIKQVGCTPPMLAYVGLGPRNPSNIRIKADIDTAITEMRKDGTLSQILSKYEVDDWVESANIDGFKNRKTP